MENWLCMGSLCVMCGFESVKNQRRVLHSTSTVHVLPLLRRLVRDEIDDAPSHVLCMRCFRLLDKCFKLALFRIPHQVLTVGFINHESYQVLFVYWCNNHVAPMLISQ